MLHFQFPLCAQHVSINAPTRVHHRQAAPKKAGAWASVKKKQLPSLPEAKKQWSVAKAQLASTVKMRGKLQTELKEAEKSGDSDTVAEVKAKCVSNQKMVAAAKKDWELAKKTMSAVEAEVAAGAIDELEVCT